MVGKNLQIGNLYVLLSGGSVAPAGGLSVLVSSADAALLKVAPDAATVGGGSLMLSIPAGQNGTAVTPFVLQSLGDTGTVQLTASAGAGITDATSTVALWPSGFIFNSPFSAFTTTTSSANEPLNITSGPFSVDAMGKFHWNGYQSLRAGFGPVNVQATATDRTGTNVGAIVCPAMATCTSSPPAAVFNAGQGSNTSIEFDPQNPGTTLLELLPPAGFQAAEEFTSFVVTVTP
jgi:hypothetical protein